jgi:hypothetical protein
VKLKILHVHNASSFSARLLEHTDFGGCPVPIPDEYFTVNMAVYSHYSDEQNRYKQYQDHLLFAPCHVLDRKKALFILLYFVIFSTVHLSKELFFTLLKITE